MEESAENQFAGVAVPMSRGGRVLEERMHTDVLSGGEGCGGADFHLTDSFLLRARVQSERRERERKKKNG
jgi:hypothetical protein